MFVRNLKIKHVFFAVKIWRFDAAGFNIAFITLVTVSERWLGPFYLPKIKKDDSHFDLRVFPFK